MAGPLISLTEDAATCEGGVCALPAVAPSQAAQPKLTLIGFPGCPFLQRAITALKERGLAFETVDIDPADQPDWFVALSPLGKAPVLKVERQGEDPVILIESAAIMACLDNGWDVNARR